MNEIPAGMCQCGCGQHTKRAVRNRKSLGHLKGQYVRFVPGHHLEKSGTPPKLVVNGNLVCNTCNETKPVEEFTKARHKVSGLSNLCKTCRRAGHLQRTYGIEQEAYDRMLRSQEGVCAVCQRPETTAIWGATIPLAVDHDHSTGRIRALLCKNCNEGIGSFKDSPELLRSAANYLETHR